MKQLQQKLTEKDSKALEVAKALCVMFEGFRAERYLCPAGVLTIGFGTTQNIPEGPITKDEALELLDRDLMKILPAVSSLCPNLNSNQLGAVLSWTYNLGIGNLKKSTMLKRIQEENYKEAAIELRRWNKVNKKVLKGLVNRRELESKVFTL